MRNILIALTAVPLLVVGALVLLRRQQSGMPQALKIDELETCDLDLVMSWARMNRDVLRAHAAYKCVVLRTDGPGNKALVSSLNISPSVSAGKQMTILAVFDTSKDSIVEEGSRVIVSTEIAQDVIDLFGGKELVVLQ